MIGLFGPGNGQTGSFWLGHGIRRHISIYQLISSLDFRVGCQVYNFGISRDYLLDDVGLVGFHDPAVTAQLAEDVACIRAFPNFPASSSPKVVLWRWFP